MSRLIAYAKATYGMFIILQYIKGCVGWKRPFVYQFFTFIHYLMILFCEQYPQYQRYHASFCVFTYCSFVSNESSLYMDQYTESTALIIGYIASSNLSSAFLIHEWLYFSIGNIISTLLIVYYYVANFGLHF